MQGDHPVIIAINQKLHAHTALLAQHAEQLNAHETRFQTFFNSARDFFHTIMNNVSQMMEFVG